MKVRLTKFQRDELRFKIEVMMDGVADDGTIKPGYMAHSYGFTSGAELDAFHSKLPVTGMSRVCELDERETIAAWGEMENLWDIAHDNIDEDRADCPYKPEARKLGDGMDRIKAAAQAAGIPWRKAR